MRLFDCFIDKNVLLIGLLRLIYLYCTLLLVLVICLMHLSMCNLMISSDLGR